MAEQELSVGLADFPAVRKLGSGSFGKVFAVRSSARVKEILALRRNRGPGLQTNGRLLAMKQMNKVRTSARLRRILNALRENRILQKLQGSPFCVQHLCSFQTRSHLYLVTEYYSGGDLHGYLRNTQKTIRGTCFVFLAAELVAGLQFIHGKGIIHRDLKPENVMIRGTGHVVIVDLGLAIYDTDTVENKKGVGSLAYSAPETFGLGENGVLYSKMSDWWALGVTLLEAWTGHNPYSRLALRPQDSQKELLGKVQEMQQRTFVKAICPLWSAFTSFLWGLLQVDPKWRLGALHGAEEIKQHDLFSPFFPNPGYWQMLEKHHLHPPVSPGNLEEDLCLRRSRPIPVETDDDFQGALILDRVFRSFNAPLTSFARDE